jgi:methylmalonyl-CoA mutase
MKKLFSEFPEITTEAWEEKIRTDLRDMDAIQHLTRMSEEGIEIKPFYRKQDTENLAYLEKIKDLKKGGESPNQWTICQDILPGRDLELTRQRIKAAVNGGAEAIRLELPSSIKVDSSTLNALIGDLSLDETEILFQGNMRADSIFQLFTNKADSEGNGFGHLRGCLGADPIGLMVTTGFPVASMENLKLLVNESAHRFPGLRVINVSGSSFQNAGSSLVEELAFSLAIGSDYLSMLTDKGLNPQQVQDALQLNLSVGPDFIMEIAKLRAARILWASLATTYGVDPTRATVKIHTTSSTWNLTLYDPYVNMLRGTTEAVASILGGTDLMSVLPFDYPYGDSSSFSERIARNVQLILREESYLDRVADPASGSYFIETMTDAICDRSWSLFKEVEALGGFQQAFNKGWIQEKVNRSRKKKLETFSSGKNSLVGTNAFPDFNEVLLKQIKRSKEETEDSSSFQPLLPFRPSAPFEKVRLAVEEHPTQPEVFLLKYGPPAVIQARASFSGNFFACAGYAILDPLPFTSIKEGVNAAKKAKSELVVLCSSDELYEDLAAEVCRDLKDISLVVIAGYPTRSLEKLKKVGIKHFIHRNSNLLEKLEEFNSILL